MRTTLCYIVVGLLCAWAIAGDDLDEDYRILKPGTFHGSDIDHTDGRDWYGLFKTDSGYVLESVGVQTKSCHNPLVDELGDTTGMSVSVDHFLEPLILVQCRRKLQSGLVPTSFAERTSIEPGEPVFFGEYCLAALGEVTDEGFRHPSDLLILNYTLKLYKLTEETRSQTLAEYERSAYDGLPTLLWAGDLDRDGQLDLLLDIRNH